MNDRGYSLAELVLIAAIIAIIAAVGYPSFARYLEAASLRAGAQELATIVNGARQLAIQRNTNVCVTLNGTTAQYLTGTTSTCGGGTTFVGAGTQSDGSIPLQNAITITASTASVVFSNLGAATQAGTYTVHNATSGENLSVVVSASGRVRVQ